MSETLFSTFLLLALFSTRLNKEKKKKTLLASLFWSCTVVMSTSVSSKTSMAGEEASVSTSSLAWTSSSQPSSPASPEDPHPEKTSLSFPRQVDTDDTGSRVFRPCHATSAASDQPRHRTAPQTDPDSCSRLASSLPSSYSSCSVPAVGGRASSADCREEGASSRRRALRDSPQSSKPPVSGAAREATPPRSLCSSSSLSSLPVFLTGEVSSASSPVSEMGLSRSSSQTSVLFHLPGEREGGLSVQAGKMIEVGSRLGTRKSSDIQTGSQESSFYGSFPLVKGRRADAPRSDLSSLVPPEETLQSSLLPPDEFASLPESLHVALGSSSRPPLSSREGKAADLSREKEKASLLASSVSGLSPDTASSLEPREEEEDGAEGTIICPGVSSPPPGGALRLLSRSFVVGLPQTEDTSTTSRTTTCGLASGLSDDPSSVCSVGERIEEERANKAQERTMMPVLSSDGKSPPSSFLLSVKGSLSPPLLTSSWCLKLLEGLSPDQQLAVLLSLSDSSSCQLPGEDHRNAADNGVVDEKKAEDVARCQAASSLLSSCGVGEGGVREGCEASAPCVEEDDGSKGSTGCSTRVEATVGARSSLGSMEEVSSSSAVSSGLLVEQSVVRNRTASEGFVLDKFQERKDGEDVTGTAEDDATKRMARAASEHLNSACTPPPHRNHRPQSGSSTSSSTLSSLITGCTYTPSTVSVTPVSARKQQQQRNKISLQQNASTHAQQGRDCGVQQTSPPPPGADACFHMTPEVPSHPPGTETARQGGVQTSSSPCVDGSVSRDTLQSLCLNLPSFLPKATTTTPLSSSLLPLPYPHSSLSGDLANLAGILPSAFSSFTDPLSHAVASPPHVGASEPQYNGQHHEHSCLFSRASFLFRTECTCPTSCSSGVTYIRSSATTCNCLYTPESRGESSCLWCSIDISTSRRAV